MEIRFHSPPAMFVPMKTGKNFKTGPIHTTKTEFRVQGHLRKHGNTNMEQTTVVLQYVFESGLVFPLFLF